MAGLNGKVMVNAADVERSMLEVALQVVRDNPNIRRADGRKSPHMLCAEEALRLRTEMRAKNQELETLRAQLKLALSEREDVDCLTQTLRLANAQVEDFASAYKNVCKQLVEEIGRNVRAAALRGKSRWFRLGRWLGFYR